MKNPYSHWRVFKRFYW